MSDPPFSPARVAPSRAAATERANRDTFREGEQRKARVATEAAPLLSVKPEWVGSPGVAASIQSRPRRSPASPAVWARFYARSFGKHSVTRLEIDFPSTGLEHFPTHELGVRSHRACAGAVPKTSCQEGRVRSTGSSCK